MTDHLANVDLFRLREVWLVDALSLTGKFSEVPQQLARAKRIQAF